MEPSTAHVRLARPTRDLGAAVRFWVDGVGMAVLWRSGPQEPHQLVAVGWSDATWHLELVEDPPVTPAPTEEDLLVLYLGGPVENGLLTSIEAAGGRRVPARNPYWDRWGVTLEDPDGYRLVLCHRTWP